MKLVKHGLFQLWSRRVMVDSDFATTGSGGETCGGSWAGLGRWGWRGCWHKGANVTELVEWWLIWKQKYWHFKIFSNTRNSHGRTSDKERMFRFRSSSFFIHAFGQLREDHAIDYNEFMQLFPVRVQRMRELKDAMGVCCFNICATVLQGLSGIQDFSMHNVWQVCELQTCDIALQCRHPPSYARYSHSQTMNDGHHGLCQERFFLMSQKRGQNESLCWHIENCCEHYTCLAGLDGLRAWSLRRAGGSAARLWRYIQGVMQVHGSVWGSCSECEVIIIDQ